MLKILERNYKQSSDAVEQEFPNCKYIMRMVDPTVDEGYLLAISTGMDSEKEFWEYGRNLSSDVLPLFGGEYGKWIGGLFSASE